MNNLQHGSDEKWNFSKEYNNEMLSIMTISRIIEYTIFEENEAEWNMRQKVFMSSIVISEL